MKLPFTDQFLWNLYNILETIGELTDPSDQLSLSRVVASPEMRSLWKRYERKSSRKQFSKLVYYLKKHGLIKIVPKYDGQMIALTPRGVERALRQKWSFSKKRRRKDGKYIMVMFDIPHSKKGVCELFRDILKSLGYQMYQKSVWICPYDVYKETEEAIRYYKLWSYARIFLIEELKDI